MLEFIISSFAFLLAAAVPAMGVLTIARSPRVRYALRGRGKAALGANRGALDFSSSNSYGKEMANLKSSTSKRYEEELTVLRNRAEENSGYSVYGYIQGVLEKFSYLQTIELPHQIRLAAELRYVAILEKLNQLLAPDYYADFLENPSHWESPDRKIEQVERALRNLSANLDADIRSANSSRSDEFEVAAQVLLGVEDSEKRESLESFNIIEELQGYDLELESLLTTSKQELKAIEAATKGELEALDGAPLDRRTIAYSKYSNGFLYSIWVDNPNGEAGSHSYALQVEDLIEGTMRWESFEALHWAASRADELITAEAEKHEDTHRCAYCAFDYSPET